jgi:Tfp pilus assembly protein PilO
MKSPARHILFAAAAIPALVGTAATTAPPPRQQAPAVAAPQGVVDLDALDRELEEQVREITRFRNRLPQIVAELEKGIAFNRGMLPQEREADRILKEIWQSGESNSLQVRSLKPQRPKRSFGYSEQSYQISLAGDFNDFYTFLLQLEKRPQITRITQMRLAKLIEKDEQMQAQVTFTLFFGADGTAAAVSAPVRTLAEMRDRQRTLAKEAALAAPLIEKTPRSAILAQIANDLPQAASLLEFTLDSTKLTASGTMMNDAQVVQFVHNLDQSQLLGDVKLLYSRAAGGFQRFGVEVLLDSDSALKAGDPSAKKNAKNNKTDKTASAATETNQP